MKAQISIEYLVTYTMAIGVIIGLIATFSYLNTSPLQRIPTSCTLSAKVECLDYNLVHNTELKLYLENNEQDIYDITLNCSHEGTTAAGAVMNGKIAEGSKFNITCPVTTFNIQEDQKTKIDITLQYHLNYSTNKNWRYFRGTVIEKAK